MFKRKFNGSFIDKTAGIMSERVLCPELFVCKPAGSNTGMRHGQRKVLVLKAILPNKPKNVIIRTGEICQLSADFSE